MILKSVWNGMVLPKSGEILDELMTYKKILVSGQIDWLH